MPDEHAVTLVKTTHLCGGPRPAGDRFTCSVRAADRGEARRAAYTALKRHWPGENPLEWEVIEEPGGSRTSTLEELEALDFYDHGCF